MSFSEISVSIKVMSSEVRATDRQNVRFTLTNNSDETICVLKWNTPLEGINNNIFRIEKDGKVAVYLGKLVKRGTPRPEDYATIEPRSSVSSEVDLLESYDISEPGVYDVTYVGRILDIGTERPEILSRRFLEQPHSPIQPIQSNVARFTLLEPREPLQINGISVDWLTKNRNILAMQIPSFNSCSATQQSDLNSALKEAEKIAKEAMNALSNTPEGRRSQANRYKEWFGSFDKSRYDKVTLNFSNIWDALSNRTITFNCSGAGCGASDYAYVKAGSPYEIHLCNLFWSAPLSGT
ncbi:MAG: M35 family metallo-endopeptidase, partial [Thermoproteota archaeon]|nr:M35 family metallo-endopeptidase [Thermoproteota archaeon]